MASAPLIDLRAARAAARLVLPSAASDGAAAAQLRLRVAEELGSIDAAARRWTQLGVDLPPTEARVVGRMGWVDANLRVLAGVVGQMSPAGTQPFGGAQLIGAQLGTMLGLLSTRVLGQFVLPLAESGAGQLVVVGPNVIALGRRTPHLVDDLRRTVLLHEVAHRLQFDGVAWLGPHLRGLVAGYVSDGAGDPAMLARLVTRLPQAIIDALRGGGFESVLHAVLSPSQRAALDETQALMSLLEGHGNATMRLAAPGVVDDPDGVSAALSSRRDDVGAKLLRAVGGLARKERQYTEGEAFVREVVAQCGVAGLNRVFGEPGSLPRPHEIADPARWLGRIAA
ncbi:MAG: coenzyme F420 biosynthesis associated uncharacterized protein [Nitriliruptoraceae bacterium]